MGEDNRVPYIVYEGTLARMDRIIKRLWIFVLAALIALVVSNVYWIYTWSKYDYSTVDITAAQDGRGINIIGGGSVGYGADSPNPSEDTSP